MKVLKGLVFPLKYVKMNYNVKIEKCGVTMEQQVMEKKETEKTKNLPLFILKIVGNVIFYLIIIALLLFSIMNIRAGNKVDGYPNIFGKGFLSVQTDSMKGDKEDSFEAGDLIIVSVFKEKKVNDLKVGDVITFYDATVNDNKGGLNSHRIVYINRESEDNQSGNITSVVTQGDKSVSDFNWTYNPDSTDPNAPERNLDLLSHNHVQMVQIKDIRGVMTSVWHGAGTTLDNVQKYWLFIFVLPVLLFLIFEILMVAKNVMALKNEKKKSQIDSDNVIDIEAQKEELRAQILAELKAEQEKQAIEAETVAEEKPGEATEEAVEAPEVIEEMPQEEEVSEPKEVEAPVALETPVEEPVAEEPVIEEPVVESIVEEPQPKEEEMPAPETIEVKQEEQPKKTTTRKTTGTKKTTSTTKKTTTSTSAAKKPAAKKSTAAKKATAGEKKTTSTAKKSSTGAKTTTTSAKKPASSTKKTTASTGTKKTTSSAKKTTAKKTGTEVAKEKGE